MISWRSGRKGLESLFSRRSSHCIRSHIWRHSFAHFSSFQKTEVGFDHCLFIFFLNETSYILAFVYIDSWQQRTRVHSQGKRNIEKVIPHLLSLKGPGNILSTPAQPSRGGGSCSVLVGIQVSVFKTESLPHILSLRQMVPYFPHLTSIIYCRLPTTLTSKSFHGLGCTLH